MGKKKKEDEGQKGIKGRMKYKEDVKLSGLVSQVLKAKKRCEEENELKNNDDQDSDDECIEEMRRELLNLESDSSEVINNISETKEVQRKSKVHKWKKVCSKLAS